MPPPGASAARPFRARDRDPAFALKSRARDAWPVITESSTGLDQLSLENLVALHLRKACDFWTDTAQGDFELRYIRDKEGREVDFLILRDKAPFMLVECKTSDTTLSPALERFATALSLRKGFQLVDKPGYDRKYAESGLRVLSYEAFLAGLV